MNITISEEKYPILSIWKCVQKFKNVFVDEFQNLGCAFHKGEIKEIVHILNR